MARHNQIGIIGEDVVAHWLAQQGHTILERNYRRKFGEIDIITRGTDSAIHFVEVKTVSYETMADLLYAVSHETWRPEEMVHIHKQRRLLRTIQVWQRENAADTDFQIDVVTARLVPREKYARLKHFRDVIFDV